MGQLIRNADGSAHLSVYSGPSLCLSVNPSYESVSLCVCLSVSVSLWVLRSCGSLQAEEAEATYKTCIADATTQDNNLQHTKVTVLRQLQEVVKQSDQTLRSVSSHSHKTTLSQHTHTTPPQHEHTTAQNTRNTPMTFKHARLHKTPHHHNKYIRMQK